MFYPLAGTQNHSFMITHEEMVLKNLLMMMTISPKFFMIESTKKEEMGPTSLVLVLFHSTTALAISHNTSVIACLSDRGKGSLHKAAENILQS